MAYLMAYLIAYIMAYLMAYLIAYLIAYLMAYLMDYLMTVKEKTSLPWAVNHKYQVTDSMNLRPNSLWVALYHQIFNKI